MSDFSTLELVTDPRGFATLWLNRPHKRNAFDAQMVNELILALELVAADKSLRFLVLRGRGSHFCSGADLHWMRETTRLDYASNLREARTLAELMYNLYHLKIPTLAVLQGAVFGGAMGLACCCDIAIASDETLFALTDVRIGLTPAVVCPFVVQAIGERATRCYSLTGERFNAQRARELQLLAEHYPLNELDAAAEHWITKLLKNSPVALLTTKDLLREVGSGALSKPLRGYTENAIARLRISPEGREGLDAFLEKRPAAWRQST